MIFGDREFNNIVRNIAADIERGLQPSFLLDYTPEELAEIGERLRRLV